MRSGKGMTLRRPKLILIDVDGTLVDSVPDLAFCVDELMVEFDMPRRGEAAVRTWVGNGVERLVKRALLNRLDGEPDDALFEKALPMFMDLYAEHTSARSRLYPGVEEGLAYMLDEGYLLGSVTNKAGRFTERLLKDMGIFDCFKLVVAGDTLPVKKPDPLPLLHAARQLGVVPADSMMLGDSKNDVNAARAAGFQVVCVNYGYNHGEDIRLAHPDAVIDSFTDLRLLLEKAA